MRKTKSPLSILSRTDKWYLGGGNRLIWTPEFPAFLDQPGFWDHGHYYNYVLGPIFTWTLLDSEGREIVTQFRKRRWTPASLSQEFATEAHLRVTEEKSILPNDVALSVVRIRNTSAKAVTVHCVAWTAAHMSELSLGTTASFTRNLGSPARPDLPVACVLGVNRPVHSSALCESETAAVAPRWPLTPFREEFSKGSLDGARSTHPGADFRFVALHCRLTIGRGKEETITIACAAAPSVPEASRNLKLALKQKDPLSLSVLSWEDHFSGVPSFECSDEFFNRYYWYRWYGLRLNTMYGCEGNYRHPFVCEGIGYFRAPISYSAPCHMLENKWMHEPELARGSLLTFLDHQREDGGLRGYIDVNHYRQEMFYHANWGRAILQLDYLHPSRDFLQSAYERLKKYAAYFDRERDEEVSALYDIDNHYETGQEYMSRYLAVHPQADKEHWGKVFRLKGVDVTVYVYELKQALASMSERLGKPEEAGLWHREADRIKTVVLSTMWDPADMMFYDVDPVTKERTRVKAATCFYPYMTDLVGEEHVEGLKRHLLNKKEFWTNFPVPSTSMDDEYFSAEPLWKGKRMNCPWNGRVWPMTNSHAVEALASTAIRFSDEGLKRATAALMSKFVRMMFFDGDPKRPNCFEHYNPLTGTPSLYRGIDDYQHSWVNDLIIQYVCGVRADAFSVTIDPFPFGLRHARLTNVLVRGRQIDVEIRGKNFTVWLDGKRHVKSVVGKPVMIQL